MRVPTPARPDVSVVMVTHNRWDLTQRAIAALIEVTEPRYQLIVVDNGSADSTPSGLAEIDGATVLRNSTNIGFGPASNQGAGLARGRHLVFLNNDANVLPGWLDPLVNLVDSDPAVAAAAPRLLYPDGRLQEAGSILWRNGRVRSYGDGDVADQPEYLFRRVVDCASAACLLVRRKAFVNVGGFDARFAPAYCEDIDLCLGLSSTGGRVVYQPRSTVEHIQAARGNPALRRRVLPRNRRLLSSRWRTLLDRRPPESRRAEPAALIGGRDAMTCERILILTSRLPSARGEAGDRRLFQLLRAGMRRWHGARWTVAALDGKDAGVRAWNLGDAGVEAIWGKPSWGRWMHDRRFHYGIVIVADPHWETADLEAVLEATQPQALRISMGSAPGDCTATVGADLSVELPSETGLIDPAGAWDVAVSKLALLLGRA